MAIPNTAAAPATFAAALVVAALMVAPAGAAPAPGAAAAAPPSRADCDTPGFETELHRAPPLPAALADARAVWLDARRLRWPGAPADGRYVLVHSTLGTLAVAPGASVQGHDAALPLHAVREPPAAATADRFKWLGPGTTLELRGVPPARLRALHRGQLVLLRTDDAGGVLDATAVQAAAALDMLYAAAARRARLGAHPTRRSTAFRLWAPTARRAWLCLHAAPGGPATQVRPLRRDASSGVWSTRLSGDLSGQAYRYLVDVFVRGRGVLRNRVTDPYALALTANSQHGVVVDLDAPALKPPRWNATPVPRRVAAPTDLVIYELHVRDFSVADATVPPAARGKYLAFTHAASDGMRHLRRLADAGVTDVHLLPVFDFATVPERGCRTPAVPRDAAPDSHVQQAAVVAAKDADCFNWGYDPLHFSAPEGSYASNVADPRARIVEFRAMVGALHDAGLRVGMDVVYNHTSASGQHADSVLDRIVPGYYHRLGAKGEVETSTCCANTATEQAMMEKLMVDSALSWVRHYRIDSLRFDLMGHQPRAAMERLQRAVDAAAGRRIHLIGEGWDFGEVAGGARFVQAAQRSLQGSGIATFNDRLRDAVRGGGAGDDGVRQLERQGFANGLHLDPNPSAAGRATVDDLLRSADLVRAGLAGSIRDFRLVDASGANVALHDLPYAAGQPAGYAAVPGEVVNYVENHDNLTLFDANAFKLPAATSREDRARVQLLAAAAVAFAQGIAYFHAGQEILRSKSMDRNSYDSGDWFNRLDWTLADNGFGHGLPPRRDNEASWPWMAPLLADASIKPAPADIAWMRDAFVDLLRIRAGTTLLRLRSAADIRARLRFHGTGPAQVPGLIVGHVAGAGYPGAVWRDLVYVINADKAAHALAVDALKGMPLELHPVHAAPGAADRRAATATFDPTTGTLAVPPRTAVVFVAR
jgi:pullulanase/glycogen debranching enzyme